MVNSILTDRSINLIVALREMFPGASDAKIIEIALATLAHQQEEYQNKGNDNGSQG